MGISTHFPAGEPFPKMEALEPHVRGSLFVWHGILTEYLELTTPWCWQRLRQENEG